MLKKFRAAVFAAALLWLIVLVQIIVTRVYVSRTAFTQAFATNHVTVSEEGMERHNTDARNSREGNLCTQGEVQGRLSQEEMRTLARRIFHTLGGGEVLSPGFLPGNNYYTSYGYTTGIGGYKKVNGRRINMHVAISYDEKKDVTKILFGSPIINSDF